MLPEETKADSFVEFVTRTEARLRIALSAAHGSERGREAAAEALAYAWEHWDRINTMDNPVGYLYRVGHNHAKSLRSKQAVSLPGVDVQRIPWVEPSLPAALAKLSEQQRVVVALLHGYQWSMSEVAELLDVSKSTVQSYDKRGLARLRSKLGVEL